MYGYATKLPLSPPPFSITLTPILAISDMMAWKIGLSCEQLQGAGESSSRLVVAAKGELTPAR